MRRPTLSPSLLALLLAGGSLPAAAAPFAYIANYGANTVSVLDTTTNRVVATVPTQAGPHDVAVKPDGTRVYVANESSNTVTVIDARSNEVIAHIPVGTTPDNIAVKPDGTRAYVANYSGTVSVIDTASNTVFGTISLGGLPYGVAFNPAGTRVYFSRYDSGQVYIIDTTSNAVVGSPIAVGAGPALLRVNPAGTRLYVANYNSNNLSVIGLETDPPRVLATVTVGASPWAVAIKPDGTRVYVSNRYSDTVSVIDAATNAVVGIIQTADQPLGLDVTPAGNRLYVANYGANSVSVFNTANNTLIVTIPVGTTPISGGAFIGPAPAPATTTRLSKSSAGGQARGDSTQVAVSADGRYAVFASDAANLATGDRNGDWDVFVQDRIARQTRRLSVGIAGAQPNGPSYEPVISADGRFVAFSSDADNLVGDDTNGVTDVFVRPLAAGTTQRVSVTSAGVQGNGASYAPAISADGSKVAFTSEATNLAAGDTNGLEDVFLRNRTANTTVRVSVANGATAAQGNGSSGDAALSGNGQLIAFVSNATNLVTGDSNRAFDCFVRDIAAKTTVRVSVAGIATQANRDSWQPALSSDGRYVAFASDATNLAAGDTNAATDIFLRDRTNRTTTLISRDSGGSLADGPAYAPALSNDGRYIAFESLATLDPMDFNLGWDVYLRDRTRGTTERMSVSTATLEGNGDAFGTALSADGRYVLFESSATNLVSGDTNNAQDIFVRDRGLGTTPGYPAGLR